MKNIVFYLLFIFGLTELNAIDIKHKNEYQNVKLNFELDQLNQEYKIWKKINTGTYTYICQPNTFFGRNTKAILFVKNNVIVQRVILPSHRSEDFTLYQTLHLVVDGKENKFLKNRRDRAILRAHLNCNIDEMFNDILSGYFEKSRYDNFEIYVKYDTNYSFISTLIVKKIPNKKYYSKHSRSWSRYLSSMLMLPKNTQFTDDIVKRILNKYKQTWECEKKLLAARKINNGQNLTMIEKEEEKKLECLDKYLVWDENETK